MQPTRDTDSRGRGLEAYCTPWPDRSPTARRVRGASARPAGAQRVHTVAVLPRFPCKIINPWSNFKWQQQASRKPKRRSRNAGSADAATRMPDCRVGRGRVARGGRRPPSAPSRRNRDARVMRTRRADSTAPSPTEPLVTRRSPDTRRQCSHHSESLDQMSYVAQWTSATRRAASCSRRASARSALT